MKAVEDVEEFFKTSKYSSKTKELKGFQILEGIYTFLAYLAFVKNETQFYKMAQELEDFIKKRDVKIKDILCYNRFGKNYLLSLPTKKIIFYLLFYRAKKSNTKNY
ncbi:hypothetical protein [Chryseobacterium indoltheticum]|uniref:hypothetical protein n=1 Tax=Chryseobacterium indoltheticum TaxID=254 RepID=UPI003F4938D7